MSIENKDMKKKVTVVGAIALSAVLASGVGYTSYNILKEKTTEEKMKSRSRKRMMVKSLRGILSTRN